MTEITERLKTAITQRYVIERELGQGGMATVYLARDIRHDRKVALKVLRPELAAVIGAERFLQEIKVTANLQHPHILPLHDSGEADGFLFYVMPYVQGESLRSRLDREKQLAVDDAVEIARAVGSALDYAHRHGVIHRDIKPANILIQDGQPLIADFGIALAVSHAGGHRLTETGLSIGTPHYMSPEQAMGDRALDARSDVYSLGAMLFEMLTGDPPFTGSTAQAIVAKVITEKAPPVTAIRDTVPPHVSEAVQRALSKLPADRFSTAASFTEAISLRLSLSSVAAPAVPRRPAVRIPGTPLNRILAASLVAVAVLAAWALLDRPSTPVVRVAMKLPDQQGLVYSGINLTPPRLAITPDGQTVIYAGVGPNATPLPGGGPNLAGQFTLGVPSQLWIRPLRELDARPMAGTDRGWAPAISPNGREVVFTVIDQNRAQIKVMPLAGGPPITVATLENFSSASWGGGGYVYFVDVSGTRILRVLSSGGPVDTVTALPSFPAGARLLWPDVLPDGKGAIATVGLETQGRLTTHEIHAVDFAAGTSQPLVPGVYGQYVPSGHLLYVTSDNVLMAVRFDPRSRRLAGRPTALIEGVDYRNNGASDVALSPTGSLVYATDGVNAPEQIVWAERSGQVTALDPGWGGELEFEALALSPDGSRLALEMVTRGQSRGDVWIKQLPRGPLSRLTFEGVDNRTPSWSADGRTVTYLSREPGGSWSVMRRPADGSGAAERLPAPGRDLHEVVWSPDGAWLLGSVSGPPSDDIVALRVGDTAWIPVVNGPSNEYEPVLSPGGRWLAYVSEESGRAEIYVRPFPNTASGRWQISTDGGIEPTWGPTDGELYYRVFDGNVVWRASLEQGPSAASRSAVFRIPQGAFEANPRNRMMALTPDARRFILVNQTGLGDVSGDLVFVQNLLAELRAKVR
jgi:serine/threonine-protein kinase